jgi:hypothetical protein
MWNFGSRTGRIGGAARWLGILAVAAVAGCATVGGGLTKDTPPDVLKAKVQERALARWQLIIDGDLEKAYADFMSAPSKEVASFDAFRQRVRGAGVVYRSVEPDSVTCQGEACTVKLYVWFDHRMIKGSRTPLEEVWVLDKGQAWYVWRQ